MHFPAQNFIFQGDALHMLDMWNIDWYQSGVMFVIIRIQILPFVMFTISFAFLLNLQHNSLVLNFNSPLFKYNLSHCI